MRNSPRATHARHQDFDVGPLPGLRDVMGRHRATVSRSADRWRANRPGAHKLGERRPRPGVRVRGLGDRCRAQAAAATSPTAFSARWRPPHRSGTAHPPHVIRTTNTARHLDARMADRSNTLRIFKAAIDAACAHITGCCGTACCSSPSTSSSASRVTAGRRLGLPDCRNQGGPVRQRETAADVA
jgi:hypothetical protein